MMHERKEVFSLFSGDPSNSASPDVLAWILIELVTTVRSTPLIWVVADVRSSYRAFTTSVPELSCKFGSSKIKHHDVGC